MKSYLGLSAVLLCLTQTTALYAQDCANGTCGPRISRMSCVHGQSDCGHYGLKQNPLSEMRYIKQFCRPTISPDSCFGHFRNNITPWTQACPNWPQDVVHPGPYMFQRPAATAPAPSDTPKELPKPPVKETSKEAMPTVKEPVSKDPMPTTLPSPKEMKPMLPVPDTLPKPPTIPTKPMDLPKPPTGKGEDLPKVPNIPAIPADTNGPSTNRIPF
jgi:hypothetical protein